MINIIMACTCASNAITLLVLILQQIFSSTMNVVFLEEPQDICIHEGEDAYLPCVYTGTAALPRWRISENVYFTNTLPDPYYYDGNAWTHCL